MLKHRDNIVHPPLTVDPHGSGTVTMSAGTPHSAGQLGLEAAIAGAPAAAGRKRPRDIRSIERFRQVIYGDKGLGRFHAMVMRNPILMYPPEGVDAARKSSLSRCSGEAEPKGQEPPKAKSWTDDMDLLALLEERHAAEVDAMHEVRATGVEGQDVCGLSVEGAEGGACNWTAVNVNHKITCEGYNEEDLANYHHRQLDALVGLYYEFNHLTFMKLPMNDTLQLLRRCGREAIAHTIDFESGKRLQRDAYLKELSEVAEEERRLKARELEMQERVLEAELRGAEDASRLMDGDSCDA
ncbi:hypothetical protein ERJ75_000998100 [Trypanosoma vivax]|nr:hypothetical protein ERJ75_000998100 [Trypanosoma vivax]